MNEKELKDYLDNNKDKVEMAKKNAKEALGGDAEKLIDMFMSEENLKKISGKVSTSDMQKISSLLDNPDMLKKILSSGKAKEAIKKMSQE